MSELKTENANAFIGWGVFLLFFPAIAGTIYILTITSSPLEWVPLAIVISYIFWGWASVIAGIILIVVGSKRKSNAAKLAKPEEPQSAAQ